MLTSRSPSDLYPNGCSCAWGLQAVLDCLDMAVFLLDGAGRVSWRNRSAHALIGENDGLTISGDRLGAQWPADRCKLAATLSTASTATIRITRPSGRPAYVAHVHRLRRDQTDRNGSTVLLVTAPERLTISETGLRKTYELTPAEARVALAVTNGMGLTHTAQNLRLSINTVKSTLQRVFWKTQTHSQPQLVRLLVSTVARPYGTDV